MERLVGLTRGRHGVPSSARLFFMCTGSGARLHTCACTGVRNTAIAFGHTPGSRDMPAAGAWPGGWPRAAFCRRGTCRTTPISSADHPARRLPAVLCGLFGMLLEAALSTCRTSIPHSLRAASFLPHSTTVASPLKTFTHRTLTYRAGTLRHLTHTHATTRQNTPRHTTAHQAHHTPSIPVTRQRLSRNRGAYEPPSPEPEH